MSMKNILSHIPKKLAAALVVATVALGIATAAIAGFGPDRPTKDWTTDPTGFDHVTFNSFVNVGAGDSDPSNDIGDERDFFRGGITGVNTPWIDPVNNVSDQDVVEAKIYIHNNAKSALNDAPGNPGIATDLNVKVALPSGIKTSQEATATIHAGNATPKDIYDTLSFTGINGSQFELEYVAGSAVLHEGAATSALSDTLVTTGVALNDQKACFEFIREITFRMKIKKPGYQIQKTARIKGEGDDKWRKEVNAKIGDQIEWRIYFHNIGSSKLNAVSVVDQIPSFHTVVPGSIVLKRTGKADYTFPDTAIQANGRQVNAGISSYESGKDGTLYLTTVIQNVPELRCGVQQMANVVYVTPEGLGTLNDNAKVNVINQNSCEEPTNPVYSCNAVNITKLGGRKVRVDVSKTAMPANRVSVKNYEYNFGDGSTALVSDKNPVEYTFAKDGTFKVSVKVSFTVDGQTKTSTNICEAVVTFTTPKEIPNTGAGSMIGTLTAISIVGMLFHRAWTLRQTR